jgi:hypothetical protein
MAWLRVRFWARIKAMVKVRTRDVISCVFLLFYFCFFFFCFFFFVFLTNRFFRALSPSNILAVNVVNGLEERSLRKNIREEDSFFNSKTIKRN